MYELAGLLIIALGVGGSDPFTTTPLSFHFRLPKKNNTATRVTRNNVPATLTPAIAPSDRLNELAAFAGADVLVGVLVGVVTKLELIVEEAPVEEGPVEEVSVENAPVELTLRSSVIDADADFDVVVVAVSVLDVVSNIAALFGLLDNFAAIKFWFAQPSISPQASIEQQPRKGVSRVSHAYQWPPPTQA